jgi:predicted NAD-dependent protein-ADP-ribosyltransferase YbiA (DUF1768 family)
MEKPVLLFDPQDIPFGKLSPNYKLLFDTKNEHTANNIISYCYGGLVPRGKVRNDVLSSPSHLGKRIALEYAKSRQDEIFENAILEAFKHKYSDENIRRELLDTGMYNLVYTSGNVNYFGGLLTIFRNNMVKELIRESEQQHKTMMRQTRSNIISAYNTLESLIMSGKSDLSEFLDESPSMIIQKLKVIPADINIDLGKSEKLKQFIRYPFRIASVLRKQHIGKYNVAAREHNKLVVVSEYIDSMMTDIAPISARQEMRSYFLKSISTDDDINSEWSEFVDRVFDLWKLGMVPSSPTIHSRLKKVYSEEEIDQIQKEPLSTVRSPIYRKFIPNTVGKGMDLIITQDNINNPYFPHLMEIGGLLYPTVVHYARVKQYQGLSEIFPTIGKAYSQILVDVNGSTRDLNNFLGDDALLHIYEMAVRDHVVNTLEGRARHSLIIKFMDENLKRLLVATGGRQLLYDDSEDLVLGTGPIDHKNHGYRGNNFIGNFMEELRGDFIKSGVLPAVGLEEEKDLHIDAIIANSDEKTWIMQKIDDILIILQYLRNYDNAKYGSNRMNIDTEDVDVVLDNLYSKCFSLFKRFHVENARIPKDFIAHVKKSFDGTGMYMNKPAIRKLWSYVLFIMESVRKLVDFNISDFGNEIVKFENLYRATNELRDITCLIVG